MMIFNLFNLKPFKMKRSLFFLFAIIVMAMFSCEKESVKVSIPQTDDFITYQTDGIISGEYIVLLNENVSRLKSTVALYSIRQEMVRDNAKDLFLKAGIPAKELNRAYASAVVGFAVSLTESDVENLKNLPEVRGVWPNRVIALKKPGTVPTEPAAQVLPYGISRVGYGSYTGSHIAWIIDTGIDLDHPDLNVNASKSVTFVSRTYSGEDDNGHGSHCAGIIAAKDNDIGVVGVAAGAELVAVKVLDKRGSGSMDVILAGVDYVAANATPGDVANMSLGGGAYDPLDLAVENLGAQGVFVSLAAGNETDDANNHSPARANGTNIYTVSAMDVNDYFASFSNYGNPPVDYCAPGVNIYSTYKSGGYATMSGTSMAAPHVCGLLLATGGNLKTDGYVIGDPDGQPDPISHK
jgi:subtilisin family serine protease